MATPCSAARGAGPLVLSLAVRGELRPRVNADGRGAALVDYSGSTALTYDELSVIEAEGCELDTRFVQAGAAYALRRTPVAAVCCSGDGSGTACPCGNNASAGKGCTNTTGSGAALRASGTCSGSLDDLLLGASGLVPGRAGLYFQGSNALNGGLGNMLGDGLLCAGGGLVRLQVVVADAAGNSGTTLDIAAAGAVLAGQTRRYQLWYRDPLASPCGSGFNLSNGLEVNWQP